MRDHDQHHNHRTHDHTDHTGHDHNPDHAGDAALAELLDLDGVVLDSYWTEVLTSVQDAAADTMSPGRRRILDLGAGSGTGTIPLARRFTDAEVIAIDSSMEMLEQIRAKALDLGLAQIHTMQADLDLDWPSVAPIDITWASMSMHHLADPDRVLRDIFAATRPGGLIALVEFTEPLRFLPDDLGIGQPGLETRCLDALSVEHTHAVPELGSDWAPRLAAAGFTVSSDRPVPIKLDPPHSPEAVRYAQLWLERMRSGLADRLTHADQETLAILLDGAGPDSLPQRNDLQIRGSRTLTLAQRP